MERYFNIAGPCILGEHHRIPALERQPGTARFIDRKRSFVIHAAAALLLAFAAAPAVRADTVVFNGVTWTFTVEGDGSATLMGANPAKGVLKIPGALSGRTVKAIGTQAFYGKDALVSVVVPSSVKTIFEKAFENCDELKSVTLGSGVSDIKDFAFRGCGKLSSLTVPGNVKIIRDEAFSGCVGLTSLTLGEGVESIGNEAFSGCVGLQSVAIPASVTHLGLGSFWYCTGLKAINVAPGNATYASEEGVVFSKDKSRLIDYPCGKTGPCGIPDGVTRIQSYAFFHCAWVTQVRIPPSVTSVGDNAFLECGGLHTLIVPLTWVSTGKLDAAGVPAGCNIMYSATIILPKTVWRFHSPTYNGHFYTIDEDEKASLAANDHNWEFEGPAYRAHETKTLGTVALHRFYSAAYKGHFYTIDEAEKDSLIANNPNWTYEGRAYYVYPSEGDGLVPVHRFWSARYHHHFFTTDEAEKNDIVAHDKNWKYEGIAFYAIPATEALQAQSLAPPPKSLAIGVAAGNGEDHVDAGDSGDAIGSGNSATIGNVHESTRATAVPKTLFDGWRLLAIPGGTEIAPDDAVVVGDLLIETLMEEPREEEEPGVDEHEKIWEGEVADFRFTLPDGAFTAQLWDGETLLDMQNVEGFFDFDIAASGAWYNLRILDAWGGELLTLWLRAE